MIDRTDMRTTAVDAVVFDLGGVLIDWNPRHLYRKLFEDEARMEQFLTEICSPVWNVSLDAGRSFDDGIAELLPRHPEEAHLIRAWKDRWEEMLAGPIHGTVAILEELHAAGVALHALTNWSAETFPIGRRHYPFLDRFRTILVSGQERIVKPDPRIFHLLIERTGVVPQRTVFIDDSQKNADAAAGLGFKAIRFTDPENLRARLSELGALPAAAAARS
jgi:2-haloacid dehalogenase